MTSTQLTAFLKSHELGLSSLPPLSSGMETQYRIVYARKRNGQRRELSVPSKDLKWIQTRILKDLFIPNFDFPTYVQGGIKNRSIRSNGSLHTKQAVVINLDLVDFFHSITRESVTTALHRLYFPPDLINVLCALTLYGNCLPQGAPTSTFLANLVGLDLDNSLIQIAEKHEVTYSRYIDDLTFSGNPNVNQLVEEICFCIQNSIFSINIDKLRIQRSHRRQTVTGLIVNKKVSINKCALKSLRQELYYCRKFGLFGHCEEQNIELSSFVKSLAGRIGYVISADPDTGQKLLAQFLNLKDFVEADRHYAKRLAELVEEK